MRSSWKYNVKLIIEYDGSAFHGWQRQPGLITVQSELDRVLRIVLHGEISAIQAAGRTDSGVHARGQVVNFKTDADFNLTSLKHSVSSLLKGRLSVIDVALVDDSFNALHSAVARQYTYRILNRPAPAVLDRGRVWHITSPLDVSSLQSAAKMLEGTHDFTSFRGSGCASKTPVKTIFQSRVINGDFIERDIIAYTVIGKGFLKQMVRNIVGSLVAVSLRDKKPKSSILEILAARDRRAAPVCAPAYGLSLERVFYGDEVLFGAVIG